MLCKQFTRDAAPSLFFLQVPSLVGGRCDVGRVSNNSNFQIGG